MCRVQSYAAASLLTLALMTAQWLFRGKRTLDTQIEQLAAIFINNAKRKSN